MNLFSIAGETAGSAAAEMIVVCADDDHFLGPLALAGEDGGDVFQIKNISVQRDIAADLHFFELHRAWMESVADRTLKTF